MDMSGPLHKLFDRLIGYYVEPRYIETGVFMMNHPVFNSPLAELHPQKQLQTQRFELFYKGMEIANGYVELGDPEEQMQRFESQAREEGRADISEGDKEYVEALRMGLAPTVGCGIGIDRLVMLATKADRIKDVILFPH